MQQKVDEISHLIWILQSKVPQQNVWTLPELLFSHIFKPEFQIFPEFSNQSDCFRDLLTFSISQWMIGSFPCLACFFDLTEKESNQQDSMDHLFCNHFSRKVVREIWLEKSGWPEKKVVLYYKSTFFLVRDKWLTRKKNPSLQNPFARTTFYTFLE